MKRIVVAIAIVAFLAISLSFFMDRGGAMAGTSGATYISGKKCKTCHIKVYKAHAETRHAKSLENLTDAGEATNAECLPCHSTGYGKTGGFVDATSTPTLAGTTCQACHGPGSAHVEKGLSKEQRRQTIEKTPKDACTKCHGIHEAHPDIGAKSLPSLQKQLKELQDKIAKLGG